jgi:hypothetical protein
MSAEYAKENKQSKLTAKQLRVNAVEEQADATEELIANLTETHTCQIESLIRANTKAMKEMLSLVKAQANTQTNITNSTNNEKKRKKEERQKKFLHAPVCKHCWKEAPIQSRRQVLGTGQECSIAPSIMEINQEHLRVRGVPSGNRDVAARQSDIEKNRIKSHLPGCYQLLDLTPIQ